SLGGRPAEADYKSFKLTDEVSKERGRMHGALTMEYEKMNDNTPEPHTMMQLTDEVSKDVEAHLISQG
ncbi:hypothetical protein PIB30_109462, partial [Stylosanthes scabra]|nr:hypothetical protein [Stylosanthes scabra]